MSTPTNKLKSGNYINRRLFHMGGRRSLASAERTQRTDDPSRPSRRKIFRRSSDRIPGRVSGRETTASRDKSSAGRSDGQHYRRFNLPFDNRRRKGDIGAWVFQHRVGLLVTIVIYLIASILFVSYRIVVYENPSTVIYVDLVDPDEPDAPKPEELRKPIELIDPASYESVMNRTSDENAKMDASLRDDRGTLSEDIYEESQRVQQELAAGRAAYEEGLDEIADISKRRRDRESSSSSRTSTRRQTTKVQGNVTVSYDLSGRTATYLHIPAYQCKEGGTVVVGITVNRNGEVVDASVERSSSSADGCISTRAVQSAYTSAFNADASAPNRQRGRITYIFVAQ